jgi:alkanesulfonate monooxygenase SsuD/methylene tetrahydromethanopterin reductase-like flavin-dependent oxidoreductase (luciferase family)
MTEISFGIKTSQNGASYEDILRIWTQADEVPEIEHAWLWDHMLPLRGPVDGDALEAWTLLAALAARTRRLRLGVIVTSNRLRPPALLAKMAATVDVIAGGRLVFGLGAGGSAVADPAGRELVDREFGAYGIDVVPPGEAVGALAESLTIARRLWTEAEPFDFDGTHYRLTGAVCAPKPVQAHLPIMVGAAGPRALRVVARHADIWNCPTRGDVAEFRAMSAELDAACAEVGRDPAEITRSVQLLVAGSEQAGGPAGPLPAMFGPDAGRRAIAEFAAAGARHIVLAPVSEVPSVRWLADEIIAPALAEVG